MRSFVVGRHHLGGGDRRREHRRYRRRGSNPRPRGEAEVRHPRSSGVAVDVHEAERAADARRRPSGNEPRIRPERGHESTRAEDMAASDLMVRSVLAGRGFRFRLGSSCSVLLGVVGVFVGKRWSPRVIMLLMRPRRSSRRSRNVASPCRQPCVLHGTKVRVAKNLTKISYSA